MDFFREYFLLFLEDGIHLFGFFIFYCYHEINVAGMGIIFNSGAKQQDDPVFLRELFEFFFPSLEFIGFISKEKRCEMGNIIITKIKLVGYGFSDGFAGY